MTRSSSAFLLGVQANTVHTTSCAHVQDVSAAASALDVRRAASGEAPECHTNAHLRRTSLAWAHTRAKQQQNGHCNTMTPGEGTSPLSPLRTSVPLQPHALRQQPTRTMNNAQCTMHRGELPSCSSRFQLGLFGAHVSERQATRADVDGGL